MGRGPATQGLRAEGGPLCLYLYLCHMFSVSFSLSICLQTGFPEEDTPFLHCSLGCPAYTIANPQHSLAGSSQSQLQPSGKDSLIGSSDVRFIGLAQSPAAGGGAWCRITGQTTAAVLRRGAGDRWGKCSLSIYYSLSGKARLHPGYCSIHSRIAMVQLDNDPS